MKSLRDEMEIVNAYELVGTYRGAAALCGTTAKTVKRVLERRSVGQVGRRPAPPRERNTAAVTQLIADRVRATDGRISAKRLLMVAQKDGYSGSPRNFRRAVAAAKAAWKKQRRTYRPWVPVPGEHLIFDWATEAGWQVFCAVLAWSRYRFIRFATDQTQLTTLALLAECFEELGGVPGILLTDRMGCLRASTVANVVVPHPEYVEFCARYRCRPDFCEAADPESKGMVEHLCGYAQTDLVIPPSRTVAGLTWRPPTLRHAPGARRSTRAFTARRMPCPTNVSPVNARSYGPCLRCARRCERLYSARSIAAAVSGSGRHATWSPSHWWVNTSKLLPVRTRWSSITPAPRSCVTIRSGLARSPSVILPTQRDDRRVAYVRALPQR
jgi:hypothetical protein